MEKRVTLTIKFSNKKAKAHADELLCFDFNSLCD